MEQTKIFLGWEIVKEIGTGGSGKVYEIKKTDAFGGEYHSAMKVISIPRSSGEYDSYRGEGMDDKSITAIFKNQVQDIVSEFQLMDKLKGNSHVVSCEDLRIIEHEHGIGWDILIRMELLETLPACCNRKGMSEEDVVRMGIDICSALELCQKHNIVHRDIKPQNIFISPNEEYKLGDFGIAKVTEQTISGTKTGTYSYMAPEVYKGNGYNASVDIYSLGMVLYWLLNDRRSPFLPLPPEVPTTSQRNAALDKRMNGEEFPPPCNGFDVLKSAVLKACAYDKAERYSSATEMRKALEAILPLCSTEKMVVFPSGEDDTDDPTDSLLSQSNHDMDKAADNQADNQAASEKDAAEDKDESPAKPLPAFIANLLAQVQQLPMKMKIIIGGCAAAAVIIIVLLIVLLSGRSDAHVNDPEPTPPDDTISDSQPSQDDPYQDDPYDYTDEPAVQSEWMDRLPAGIDSSEYIISAKQQYRSTTLYCFTAGETVGPEYLFSHSSYGPWGEWSEYQSDPIESSDLIEVETKNQYMYRNLITKQYSDDYYMSTKTSTYWSSWYWSDTPISATSTRQVQTIVYYRFRERSLLNYYYIDSEWNQFSDEVILPASNRLVNTRTLYSYIPKDGITPTVSIENFAMDDVDYTGRFSDVDDSKWYGESGNGCIGSVVELGPMSPDENMAFRPEQPMTIAEVIRSAVMLHRIYNGEEGILVPSYESFTPYLEYAVENELIRNDDFADYNSAATRQDAAYILWHSLPQSEMLGLNIVSSITDMSIDSKYYKSVYQMAQSGIIEWPSPEYSFNPEKSVSRAEMATFLDRMAHPDKRIASN